MTTLTTTWIGLIRSGFHLSVIAGFAKSPYPKVVFKKRLSQTSESHDSWGSKEINRHFCVASCSCTVFNLQSLLAGIFHSQGGVTLHVPSKKMVKSVMLQNSRHVDYPKTAGTVLPLMSLEKVGAKTWTLPWVWGAWQCLTIMYHSSLMYHCITHHSGYILSQELHKPYRL